MRFVRNKLGEWLMGTGIEGLGGVCGGASRRDRNVLFYRNRFVEAVCVELVPAGVYAVFFAIQGCLDAHPELRRLEERADMSCGLTHLRLDEVVPAVLLHEASIVDE